jgi:23S rRNA (pseudouridine1915-N3)-methyltransferase
MTIKLLAIGKTDSPELEALISDYTKRLRHYIKINTEIIPDIRNAKYLSEVQQKDKECDLILKKIAPTDVMVLLDEKGKQYSSIEFSVYLQKK